MTLLKLTSWPFSHEVYTKPNVSIVNLKAISCRLKLTSTHGY